MLRRRPNPTVSRLAAATFGLVIGMAAALTVIPLWPNQDSLGVGDRPPRDLRAVHAAQYESEVLTEQARERAAAEVEPVLRPIDPTIRTQQADLVNKALEQITIVRQRADLDTQQKKIDALASAPDVAAISTAGRAALLDLSPERYAAIRDAIRLAINSVLSGPILSPADAGPAIEQYIASVDTRFDEREVTAITEVLKGFVVQNVEVDQAATQQARDNARANVQPVSQTYTAGQVVASAGEALDAATVEALEATGVIDTGIDTYDMGAGLIFAAALALLLGGYVYLLQPVPGPAFRSLALIAFTTIVTLAGARLALPGFIPDVDGRFYAFALPVATAAMTASAFGNLQFGTVVALGTGLFTAFMAATVPDLAGASFVSPLESLELAIAYTAAGIAGAVTVYRAERLSRFAASAVSIAVATGGVLLAFWLLDQTRITEDLGWMALASGISGVGSAVLSVGILVILSHVLGVTTRLQLLELAQANSPLLRRLQDEAPGTYHHSMLVGALAERAAEQIGADSLVTRAGAYYHDIGKLAQPEYYIENIFPGAESPHDRLEPADSARKIREHVTNGMELARRHRLPRVIRDFIPQHHGNRLVVYFYRQARREGLEPRPEDFQYPGPRPRTKESAIVMLADSCEAVVRAGGQRDQDEIETSVDNVFAERLAEGQLDDCDITLREVNTIAESFKSTLRAVYHQRIEYPAAEDEQESIGARSDDRTARAAASD